MREVDDLLRSMENPDPPVLAPAWPEPRSRRGSRAWVRVGAGVGAGLALAAAVLVVLSTRPWEPVPGLRGTRTDQVELDLRMVVERGGVAVRVSPGSTLHEGERVLFRVQADEATRARLWVEGPGGETAIATAEVDLSPRDVGDSRGLVGYRFDGPGRYVFHLAPLQGTCHPCPSVEVRVLAGEQR